MLGFLALFLFFMVYLIEITQLHMTKFYKTFLELLRRCANEPILFFFYQPSPLRFN